ncbi:AraJ Arabinose efflux permease [Burkholderiales bacterium]
MSKPNDASPNGMNPEAMAPSSNMTRPLWLLLICGCLIGLLAFGIRSSFGLFVDPVSKPDLPGSFGFGREAFAFALALQNLAWGIGQPIAGALADRYGPWRVLAGGGVLFAVGLVLMTVSSDVTSFSLSTGILIGLGMSGAGHNIVLAAFGQLMPPERRAWAMGLCIATASLGQFLVVPLGQGFIEAYGWSTAVLIMAVAMATTPALALALRAKKKKVAQVAAGEGTPSNAPSSPPTTTTSTAHSLRDAITQAFGHNSYWLLMAGFFVCGFHVAFVSVHLPPYLNDMGLSAQVASWSLALIGLFNVVGGYASGSLSTRISRRMLLVWIYLSRAVLFSLFLLLPISTTSALLFGAGMGLLWLSTVTPTVQLVGVMFGNRYLSTLFGFVFLSHQVGAFVGVWLGGVLYTATGSYNIVWWVSVALSLAAALVHLPIAERLYVATPAPSPSH